MTYPVRTIVEPSSIRGLPNGEMPDRVIVHVPGLDRGPDVLLCPEAARAWEALTAAALADGITLKSVSSYRPLSVQIAIFLDRYVTYDTGSSDSKVWNGRRYWKLPGVASAAPPGHSNHGKLLAVDTGSEEDGDAGPESLSDEALAWLLANEEKFGFSHEIQTERWHIRYFAGDDIPRAVLYYEEQQMALSDDDKKWIKDLIRDEMELHLGKLETVTYDDKTTGKRSQVWNFTRRVLKKLDA